MPDDPPKEGFRIFLLPTLLVLGLVLLEGCGGWALREFDLVRASNELPRAAQEYRATGLPWVAADLIQPPVRPEQNAAPLLRKALTEADWKHFDSGSPTLPELIDNGQLQRAKAVLKGYGRSLTDIEHATLLPRLDFNRDWDLGPQLLFPEPAQLKGAAKALVDRARIESATHDGASAARDLLTARHLGALMGQEPVMLGMLVEIAIESNVDRGAERCAANLRSDPVALEKLSRCLAAPVRRPDIELAMRGEAYLQVVLCRNLNALGGMRIFDDSERTLPVVDPAKIRRSGLPEDLETRAQMMGLVECWNHLAPTLNERPPNAVAIGAATGRIGAEIERDRRPRMELARMMFPTFTEAGKAVGKLKARDLTVRALIQAMIIHARTWRYPASIKEIRGTWIDPFNGRPLHLRRTPAGIRIYSVSPDLKDNGGIDGIELDSAYSDDCDIVAAYPPVKAPVRSPVQVFPRQSRLRGLRALSDKT